MKPRTLLAFAVFAVVALAVPWVLQATGLDFYQSLASRIVVYAIAATSLNLILGYGGLVSFGHAAFVGLGAYATGVLVSEGARGAGLHLAVTLAVVVVAALVIGAISLRTRGVYFIMITLAFAQMLYYLANSLKGYGGDEGLTIRPRSLIGFGDLVLDLKNPLVLYHVALAVLAVTLVLLARFVPSRMGRALVAQRDDDVRAEALGFPTYRIKLAAFVGGVASVWGGVLGAASLLLLEEVLGAYTSHGEFWTGWVLLAIVLFTRRGLAGLFRPRAAP